MVLQVSGTATAVFKNFEQNSQFDMNTNPLQHCGQFEEPGQGLVDKMQPQWQA
jgi:hypothetical protein